MITCTSCNWSDQSTTYFIHTYAADIQWMNVMREPIDREQSTYYYDVRSADIRPHLLKLLRPHRYYL